MTFDKDRWLSDRRANWSHTRRVAAALADAADDEGVVTIGIKTLGRAAHVLDQREVIASLSELSNAGALETVGFTPEVGSTYRLTYSASPVTMTTVADKVPIVRFVHGDPVAINEAAEAVLAR